MAFVFKTIRLVPAAIRITMAGGVTYGTVKAGAWSDSSESREKLDNIQESLSNMREIEYPAMQQSHKSHPSSSERLAVTNQIEAGGFRTSLTTSWNSAVKSACEAVVRGNEDSGRGLLSGKSLTDRFSQWIK